MFRSRPTHRSRLMQTLPQAQDLKAFLALIPESDRPPLDVLQSELQHWINKSLN